ncbi:MAG: 30S ribosomal protein S8 [Candidatus Uhrbacteria bacterium GW2011_GWE2_46_68]|uniref:Small ribosomal subunit protein uS8 n=2 Tax=Candidatus Uhriibacteriota TaxID=1752732 RepID=A0A0G1Q833_9BACT|nr:MAG: 30S ribosomal protein S8 [Candidatus Uhrbacteria bacterium GW2011_GWF2_46_218]KKU41196.1 MAG: 30S ribosomal protein S8 [Candidatus Uhrbacteria bacterium GW2011_GWE2_46_68]
MMTDPLSDMLARIRNALDAQKITVAVPYSRLKFGVAKILEKEGYIQKAEKSSEWKHPTIQITLSYEENHQPVITHLRRVSKPGHRVYAKSTEMPRVLTDYGIAILSTSNGLMTNKEARVRRLGGEIICEVA